MFFRPFTTEVYKNSQQDIDLRSVLFPNGDTVFLEPIDQGAYRFLNILSYVSLMKVNFEAEVFLFPDDGSLLHVILADGKKLHMGEEFILDPFLKTYPSIKNLLEHQFKTSPFPEFFQMCLEEIEHVSGKEKADFIGLIEKTSRYVTYLNTQNILFESDSSERKVAIPQIPSCFLYDKIGLYDFEMELFWEWDHEILKVKMNNLMLFSHWSQKYSLNGSVLDFSQTEILRSGISVPWSFVPTQDGLYNFEVFEYLQNVRTERRAFGILEIIGKEVRQIDGRG